MQVVALLVLTCFCRLYYANEFIYYAIEYHTDCIPGAYSSILVPDGVLTGFKDVHFFKVPRNSEASKLLYQTEATPDYFLSRKMINDSLRKDPCVEWFEELVPKVRRSDMATDLSSKSAALLHQEDSNSILQFKQQNEASSDQGSKVNITFDDPLFLKQWFLGNDQNIGSDINVKDPWAAGIPGKGVNVCIVDDGVDYNHPDLRSSFNPAGSYDFVDRTKYPLPGSPKDRHGTRCAGQIASKPNNKVCGVGVAFDATFSAIRILSDTMTGREEALALAYAPDINHIYSCSWGPADDGMTVEAPNKSILKAIINGVLNGRKGLGSIFLFAAGNGRIKDNCNFDGYANSVFTLTIGAIDENNQMPGYMEFCPCQLAVTYSSNESRKIATTDLYGSCTESHGGTSAATPIVAGIVALALQVRPDLSWRDIQYLLIEAAEPFRPVDSSRSNVPFVYSEETDGYSSFHGWQRNGAGRYYSHKYGYGKLNAYKLVTIAKTWKNVLSFRAFSFPVVSVNQSIPAGPSGLISSFFVPESTDGKLLRLEQVTVQVNIEHERRGLIEVYLTSPMGTTAVLTTKRELDGSDEGLSFWTLMSLSFWGESFTGEWKLTVKTAEYPDYLGYVADWKLTLWGETQADNDDGTREQLNEFMEIYFPAGAKGQNNKHFRDELFKKKLSSVFFVLGIISLILMLIVSCLTVVYISRQKNNLLYSFSASMRQFGFWIRSRLRKPFTSKNSRSSLGEDAMETLDLFDPEDYDDADNVPVGNSLYIPLNTLKDS